MSFDGWQLVRSLSMQLLVKIFSLGVGCQNIVFAFWKDEVVFCIKMPDLVGPLLLHYLVRRLVGWAGLVDHPCEWFTAADPMKLIGFKADDFYQLEKNLKDFVMVRFTVLTCRIYAGFAALSRTASSS